MAKQTKRAKAQRQRFNTVRLNKIVNELKIYGSDQKLVKNLLQGKNTLSSKQTSDRLKKIENQIKKGTFSARRIVARTDEYKEVKDRLKSDATDREIFGAINRTNFYYENRDLIIDYNNAGGKKNPRNKYAEELADRYADWKNDEISDLLGEVSNLG